MKRTFSKTLFFAAFFAAIFAAAAAAEGVQEQSQNGGTQAPRPADPSYSTEEITVSGTLQLTAARPVLKSEQENYTLLYPFHLAEGLKVESGDSVTVTGYRVPGPRWAWHEQDERYLQVTAAEINGQEYDLRGVYNAGYGPAKGYGHRRGGGMHGGPGYGRKPVPRW